MSSPVSPIESPQPPGLQLAVANNIHPYALSAVPAPPEARREIISLEDLFVYLKRYWKLGAITGAALAIPMLVLLVGRTPIYRSDAALRVVVTKDHSLPFAQNEVPENSALFFVKNHKLGLMTRSYQEYFYDRFDPRDRDDFLNDGGFTKPPVARLISAIKDLPSNLIGMLSSPAAPAPGVDWERERFLKKLNLSTIAVEEMKESHIIRVSAKSPNRDLGARMANEYVEYYGDYLAYRDRERARTSYEFLKLREAEYREQAQRSRQELNRFRIENNVMESASLSGTGGDEVKRLNEQRAAVRVEYTTAESALLQADKTRKDGGNLLSVREIAQAPNVQDGYRELLKQQQDYATNLSLYGNQHNLVKQAAERVRSLEAMLQTEMEQTLKQFEATRSSASQKLASLDAELQKVMGLAVDEDEKSLELSSLVARAESDQKTYDLILEKLNQVKVEMELAHTTQVVVEDKAVAAEKPFQPNKPLSVVLSGMLFGSIFLGLPVLLGLSEDMSRRFAVRIPFLHKSLPTELGRMPAIRGTSNLTMLSEAFAPGLTRDALYKLAFEMERAAGTQENRCLLVTSAGEREGKSFLAAALGGVYCSQGKKTLVVDCNLRNPSMSQWFPHLQSGSGLSEWLQARGGSERKLECQRHGLSELYVLTSRGWATDPVSLLSQPCFAEWLQRAREEFDLVILDGPHVNGLGDAPVLAKLVQGILLVSDSRISTWKDVGEACQTLQQAGGRVLGMVGNRHE